MQLYFIEIYIEQDGHISHFRLFFLNILFSFVTTHLKMRNFETNPKISFT